MKFLIIFLVLLTTTFKCEGNLSLLGGILSSTHEKVHDVAGAVLGTINKGLNFNLEGHFGIKDQRQPDQSYEPHGQENEYYPYYNNYGHGPHGHRPNHNVVQRPMNNNQRPYFPNNNGNRPTYSGNNYNEQYGNEYSEYPNNNYQSNYQNYPNNNYNSQLRPDNQNYGIGIGYHNNQNHGYVNNQNQRYPNIQNQLYPNNQNQGNLNNQNQEYSNNQNYPNDNGYNSQNNFNKPSFEEPNNEGYGTGQGLTDYPKPIDTSSPRPEYSTPNTQFTEDAKNQEKDKNSTESITEDAPLFIPLGPNEYIYGGEKINITAPKRQTDNKPQTTEEDFPIDIRFNNE